MRCLALAQAWQDAKHSDVHFAMAMHIPALERRLSDEGFVVHHLSDAVGSAHDALSTTALARELGVSWIVVDGYQFDAAYQKRLKTAGAPLLFVDDYGHAEHYYADLILNQNVCADASLYDRRESYTRLLLGARYALLRREFLKLEKWHREIPQMARNVLVTLGGSDPDDVTLKVIRALENLQANDIEAVVVVGASNPQYDVLKSVVLGSPIAISLRKNAQDMPSLMAWADVAISAGGSTCWELAFMGLPNLVLVLADNQRAIAERLDAAGVSINLGWHENSSPPDIVRELTKLITMAGVRAEMSRRGRQLVDGKGVNRVVKHMQSQIIRLRLVNKSDCERLWKWANDPDVRAASFSSDPIPWEQHTQWFDSRLSDSDCVIYIAMLRGTPIGQIRYDVSGNQAVIAISVDRRHRGKGHGSSIIRLASRKIFGLLPVDIVRAYAKPGNEASARAFTGAGFRNLGVTTFGNHQAVHFALRKDESR
jgi:UDP-2,4-diacetamido-2,4,6-trideoxy-beta-L-altropyranose hydrolase